MRYVCTTIQISEAVKRVESSTAWREPRRKKQTISNWENDNIMPSVEMLEKIATFFQVSTDYLLGRDNALIDGALTMDITGLTPKQTEHIRAIVDDFRNTNS